FSYLLDFLSFIDLKYKAVPDYLLMLVFVLSFFITDFTLEDSFLNAFIASGAIFFLTFIVRFYIQYIKSSILQDANL
ncbi:prepilin peptidase, partial [Aliarcobacter butzleri]